MFTTVISNIRMGLTTAKPSAILWVVLYYFIAVVLLFSGVSKIIDPIPMIETMKAAFKINENLLLFAATIVPIVEVALGLLLVLKIQTKKILLATTILFLCFLVFSVYGTIIDLSTDCGCFGGAVKSEFGVTMIIRNLVLLTVVLWVVIENKKFASAGQ